MHSTMRGMLLQKLMEIGGIGIMPIYHPGTKMITMFTQLDLTLHHWILDPISTQSLVPTALEIQQLSMPT